MGPTFDIGLLWTSVDVFASNARLGPLWTYSPVTVMASRPEPPPNSKASSLTIGGALATNAAP